MNYFTIHSLRYWLAFSMMPVCASGVTPDALPEALRARGGLGVLFGGAADPAAALALSATGPWVIHLLDADETAVGQARETLQRQGHYGRITAEHWDAGRLPYADNLVNLMILHDDAPAVDRAELMRVLAPEGVAFRLEAEGLTRLDKPRPETMGDWTHPWHDAHGSLAGDDRMLEAPNAFQWIAGPAFPLAHRKNSTGVFLSAGGRVFSITQNTASNLLEGHAANHLVARDAFNGVLLWSQRWEGPLSRGYSDGLHEGIVASTTRVYGARRNDIAVFDAATGDLIEAWPIDARAGKLLLIDDLLLAQSAAGLTAFAVGSGAQAWQVAADNPWGLLAWEGRAYCLVGSRETDGRWVHSLLAIDLKDGQRLWEQPVESEYSHRESPVLRLNFARGGIVSLLERTLLRALSVEDGSELWRHESRAEGRYGSAIDSRQVGHFFAGEKVWVRQERPWEAGWIRREVSRDALRDDREAPETWLALDPLTGEVRRTLQTAGLKGADFNVQSPGCQLLTATERLVIDGRQSTVWDLATGARGGFKFARGGCQVGMIPANGLAYTQPNACGCLTEQVRGFLAITHSGDAGLRESAPGPLQPGPAYGQPETSAENGGLNDWPTYRRDGRRSAYLPATLAPEIDRRWETVLEPAGQDPDHDWRLAFGQTFTPPVVAEGLVLLAEPQAHRVIALDRAHGGIRWQFTTGGRVTAPPTVYRGLVLCGSHDGYVYALRASDGLLIWRRRAAPSDRRIMVYGQLESAWPVTGGVLVHQGLALASAGRAADAGGGLVVHAFEPQTGAVRWTRRVTDAGYGVNDPLVADDRQVFLLNNRFDVHSGELTRLPFEHHGARSARGGAALGYPPGVRYLRGGKTGMQETSWTGLPLALRKGQSSWTLDNLVEGEMMTFSDTTAYVYQIAMNYPPERAASAMWSFPRTAGGGSITAVPINGANGEAWSILLPEPSQVEAMLTTANLLVVAGPLDRDAPEADGFMILHALDGGQARMRIDLPAAPVYDGLAAFDNHLFAVLRDGRVICWEGER